jgi:hypothetical protein
MCKKRSIFLCSDHSSAGRNFMALFTESNKAYGDSGFDSEILGTGIETTQERYAAAYNVNSLLATRMLYGTDWNLLLHIGNVQDYQKRFQARADGLPRADSVVGGHTVRERLLGWNASTTSVCEWANPTATDWRPSIRRTA